MPAPYPGSEERGDLPKVPGHFVDLRISVGKEFLHRRRCDVDSFFGDFYVQSPEDTVGEALEKMWIRPGVVEVS